MQPPVQPLQRLSEKLRNAAAHLRAHPGSAERVAGLLDAIADDAAEAEARPVPADWRR